MSLHTSPRVSSYQSLSSERAGTVSALGMALLPSENQRALPRHSRSLRTVSDLNLSLVDKISLLSIGKWDFEGMEVGFS